MKLILASASPRRADLLRLMGLPFEVEPSQVSEDQDGVFAPADHVLEISRRKAQAVAARHQNALILGADTVVVLGKDILGKPSGNSEALEMLNRLSGNTHQVLTGLTLSDTQTGKTLSDVTTTDVRFRRLTPEEIQSYVSTRDPLDKAGAYGAQGRAAVFIESISGCFYNVVGLPLSGFWTLYRRLTGRFPTQTKTGDLADLSFFRQPETTKDETPSTHP